MAYVTTVVVPLHEKQGGALGTYEPPSVLRQVEKKQEKGGESSAVIQDKESEADSEGQQSGWGSLG